MGAGVGMKQGIGILAFRAQTGGAKVGCLCV